MFKINLDSAKARQVTATAASVAVAAPKHSHVEMPTQVMDHRSIKDADGKHVSTEVFHRPLTGVEQEAAKAIIKSVNRTTPQNQQIIDFNEQIGAIENYLKLVDKDIHEISPRITVVIDANKAIKELVVTRNQKAVDVMSVYAGFNFDAANGADAVTMKDFKAFTKRLGYTFICKDETRYHILLGTVLKGIRAGRYLKDVYQLKNVIEAAKQLTSLNSDAKDYTARLNDARTEHAKLTKQLQPSRSNDVTPDSFVDSFRQSLQLTRTETNRLRSRVEQTQAQIVALKGLGNKSSKDAQLAVEGITQQIRILVKERDKSLSRLKDLGKQIKRMVAEKASVQVRFSRANDTKREARLRKVTEQYAGKRNAQVMIDAEMKEFDRMQRLTLKQKLKGVESKHADRIGNGGDDSVAILKAQQGEVTDLETALVSITENISILNSNLKNARLGAALDPLAREERLSILQQQINNDRNALKNATKKVARREQALEVQLDEDTWSVRLDEFLKDDKRGKQALNTMPNTFLYHTLLSGAKDRAREQAILRWRAFLKSKIKEVVFRHGEFSNVHFGPAGFVPVPKFRKFTPELNQILTYGFRAAFKTQDLDDAKALLLPAVMSVVDAGIGHETELRTAFYKQVQKLIKWLGSPAAMPITEEIVEDLLTSKRMPLPPGKTRVTDAIVKEISKQMLTMLVQNEAVEKLAGMAYQAYRNYVLLWLRTGMKLRVQGSGAGTRTGIAENPAARAPKLTPAPIGRVRKKPTPKTPTAPKAR
jgi:hypothetical protein